MRPVLSRWLRETAPECGLTDRCDVMAVAAAKPPGLHFT